MLKYGQFHWSPRGIGSVAVKRVVRVQDELDDISSRSLKCRRVQAWYWSRVKVRGVVMRVRTSIMPGFFV